MSLLLFLGYMNLSNNNFSGTIPFIGQMTTFSELAFAGNPNLYRTPLVIKCQDEDSDKRRSVVEDKIDGGYVDQWFYLSIGLGFSMGIYVQYFVLWTKLLNGYSLEEESPMLEIIPKGNKYCL